MVTTQKPYSDKKESRPSIPKAIRERVKNLYNGRCGYCGCTPNKIYVDHIKPYAFTGQHGDRNAESNLMPACFQCNSFKAAESVEEFRRNLSYQVERAEKYSVNFRMAQKFDQIEVKPKPIIFYFERFL